MDVDRLDLIGAATAILIFVTSILVFALRISGQQRTGGPAGVAFLFTIFPLLFLLVTAPSVGRSPLYYLQVAVMIAAIVTIFLVDYYPGYEFRDRLSLVIPFVMLYFAGLGGMIGVAARAGRAWMIAAVVLFFATVTLAFISRWTTGL